MLDPAGYGMVTITKAIIEGLRSGTNGIQFTTGGNLEIENCVIRNFANTGINIVPSTSSSVHAPLSVPTGNPSPVRSRLRGRGGKAAGEKSRGDDW